MAVVAELGDAMTLVAEVAASRKKGGGEGQTVNILASDPVPPWINDPFPTRWKRLSVIARVYFKRSRFWAHEQARSGKLSEKGYKIFFDGHVFWIRIPDNWFKQPNQR